MNQDPHLGIKGLGKLVMQPAEPALKIIKLAYVLSAVQHGLPSLKGGLKRMLRPLILFSISIFLFTACSTPITEPPITLQDSCSSTDACLELDITLGTNTLTTPKTHNQLARIGSLNLERDLIASKGQHILRLNATDVETYLAKGYVVENDQLLRGFNAGYEHEQNHLNLLEMDRAWEISQGEGIVIAVIDSGVDPEHIALQDALLPGYDFVDKSNLMQDPYGHGTAVAAIIAGRGPRIKGIAPKAKILPLRTLDEQNTGSAYDIAQAILFAANLLPEMPNPHPAHIINLSLGGYGYNYAIHEAIKRARTANVLVVAAAGNQGQEGLAYPAALNEVMGVGAAHVAFGTWKRQAFSNYGPGLNLLAPTGGSAHTHWGHYSESAILTALRGSGDGVARYTGTSTAAPQVSGLAALILALGHSADKTEAILQLSSTDLLSPSWDEQTGYGLINPLASLEAAQSTMSQKSYKVQILDSESLQELSRFQGENKQSLSLSPGSYHITVWHDSNHDGLRQRTEAFYSNEALLIGGSSLKLQLRLNTQGGSQWP